MAGYNEWLNRRQCSDLYEVYYRGKDRMSGFTSENEGVERRIVYRLAMDEVIDNFGLSMVQDNEI